MTTLNDHYTQLIAGCRDELERHAYRLARNHANAPDLLQDTMVRAFKSFETYDISKPFVNWMITIMINCYIDSEKARKKLDVKPLIDSMSASKLTSNEIDPLKSVMLGEFQKQIRTMIQAKFSKNVADAACSVIVDEEEVSDVSLRHSTSDGTIRTYVKRARDLIAPQIDAAILR